MANEFVARNGVIAQNNSVVSGSLVVTNGITGSLFGTSSQALTASYVAASGVVGLNLSLISTGSVTASVGQSSSSFQVTSGSNTLMILNNSGSFTIGSSPASQLVLRVSRNITGNAISRGVMVDGTIQTDVTNAAHIFSTSPATVASAFTLSTLYNYYASGVSTGSSSAVTNQYGFYAESNMINATNNYGFFGNIASGTNLWNLYMNGTANNYMAGSLGIGTTSLTGYSLRLNKQLTGNADVYGVANTAQAQSSATTTVRSFYSFIGTQATAYTLGDLMHYWAEQDTIGAGSTVTRQYGFYVHSSLIGATNNYGFYGNIASGTNRWNLYMNGTAANYMAGALGIGSGKTVPTAQLDISGSTLITGSLGVTGPITGSSILSTGTITAQTLVVQTITSSIEYSSGSNIFGSQLTDRQTMTGSINMTGSLNLYGNQNITGSLNVSGSLTLASASLSYQHNLSLVTGSYQVIASAATGSYRCAFFDYVMFSGSVVRAGTVTSTWSGSATEYYENYTADLGGSTSGVVLQTAISSSTIQLQATASSAAWTIRSLIRLL